jgi:tRNA (adenine37-N6)-methyltransferase
MQALTPIGIIHSPHVRADETPIQPVFAAGVAGRVEVFPEYEDGLLDVEGFSHLHLIYAFDRAAESRLQVVPFLDEEVRGVFATRAPARPNPLGLSLVRLVRREGRILHVEDIDVLDGTPLLDIKPYVRRFDERKEARSGWQDAIDDETARRRGRRAAASPRRAAASRHTATIAWDRKGAVFTDARYSREHRWLFDGGVEVAASASPHVVPPPLASAAAVDPEEAFVAALASCHMLWFLSIAAARGFLVESYRDEAIGVLAAGADGRPAVTEVVLRPQVAFAAAHRPAPAEHAAMHHEAHEQCFLARSVRTDVRCEAQDVST